MNEPVALTVVEMARQAHEHFLADLRKRRVRNLLHTSRYANALADAVVASMPNPSVACAEGCASCCETYVTASIPEAIAIAAHVTTEATGQKRGALLTRLRELANARRGRTWDRITPAPCAFLIDRRCSIYSARPLACRRYHALGSSAACDAYVVKGGGTFDGSPPLADARRMDAVQAIAAELAEACRALKLESARVELSAAVLLVLEKPDTAERWLRGDRVFGTAYEPPRDARKLPVIGG